jgi:hypothetical protein
MERSIGRIAPLFFVFLHFCYFFLLFRYLLLPQGIGHRSFVAYFNDTSLTEHAEFLNHSGFAFISAQIACATSSSTSPLPCLFRPSGRDAYRYRVSSFPASHCRVSENISISEPAPCGSSKTNRVSRLTIVLVYISTYLHLCHPPTNCPKPVSFRSAMYLTIAELH